MSELLQVATTPWTALVIALLVFGFAPRLVLRLLILAFPRGDERRRELLGELDAIPYVQRPLFVAEQFEVAIVEGIGARIRFLWFRKITARWSLTDGVAMNQQHPTTFSIPGSDRRTSLKPGDIVKLGFRTRDNWGERMWVVVERRTRRGYIGRLRNNPVGIPDLWPDKLIRFREENVIDISESDMDDT